MSSVPALQRTTVPGFARASTVVVLCIIFALVSHQATLARGDGAPQINSTSQSSFRLLPHQGRVDVVVRLAITNRIPTRGGVRTYIDHWRIYVPNGATGLKVRGAGVRVKRAKRTVLVTVNEVRFDRIFLGQTRRLRITYRLPTTRPRTGNKTRVTEAYSHFCWLSQPADKGGVRAVLPSGYEATSRGSKVKTRQTSEGVVLSAAPNQDLAQFIACTDAADPARLLTSEAATSAGRTITVQGWPEDPEWAANMTTMAGALLPALEDLAGSPFPQDVMVREVSTQALDGYGGEFNSRHGIIRIQERVDDSLLLTHELAHAWFNGESMAEDWMIEAHAEWLARAAHDYWCTEPGPYPGKGAPKLRKWQYLGLKPTKRERATVDYQYAAGCTLVEAIEKSAGIAAVRRVNSALLDRSPKYGGTASDSAPLPDWREWLDAVDEVGLAPASVEDLRLAERLLIDQGIAQPKQLKGRAKARARYHASISRSSVEFMPLAVRDAMDAWRFDEAMQTLTVAEESMALARALEHDEGTFGEARTGLRLAQASSLREVQEIRDELVALSMTAPGSQLLLIAEDESRGFLEDGRASR